MAKRFTDTDIWDKEWFMKLKPVEKCLIKFIFDKCDSAGIWSPNWSLASTYIGEPVDLQTLSSFSYRLEFLGGGKIFVPDFISFQYGTLSENCKPHLKVIETLKKHSLYERVLKGYTNTIHSVEYKDKEKEEEKEEEKEKKAPKEKKFEFGFGGNVKLTRSEYDRLENEIGLDDTNACIEYLSRYKQEKGYKTKDDNLTIRRWVISAVNDKKIKAGNYGPKNGNQNNTHDKLRSAHAEAQRLLAEDLAESNHQGERSD